MHNSFLNPLSSLCRNLKAFDPELLLIVLEHLFKRDFLLVLQIDFVPQDNDHDVLDVEVFI